LKDFTLKNYLNLFALKGAIEPYVVSIMYSIAAAVIVVIICLIASRIIHKSDSKVGTILELSLLIPWLLPGTLIALGLIMTYDLPQPIMFNHVLIGTPFLMLYAYVIVKLPFSLRMLKAAFFSVDESLEEAAKTMGASTLRTFIKIILPILTPTVLAVIALAFISLLADYDLSVFLYHPSYKPLGIVIKAATEPTTTQDSKAMMFVYSVVLMIMSTTAIYFVYGRSSDKKRGK
jgi:iron(III) transport system permease protein